MWESGQNWEIVLNGNGRERGRGYRKRRRGGVWNDEVIVSEGWQLLCIARNKHHKLRCREWTLARTAISQRHVNSRALES